MSENDSLHVGDWIKVHGTDANGTVTEVSLTAVKIQNWDKTITTVPPYTLVSGSFTNYRNMQVSNTRRISRSYMIDADSVVPTDDQMLAKYAKIPLLADWIAKKLSQREQGKECNVNNPDGLADGSLDTNLGVFRAYLDVQARFDLYIASPIPRPGHNTKRYKARCSSMWPLCSTASTSTRSRIRRDETQS